MGTWKYHLQPHFQVEKALFCGALLPSAGEKKNLPLKLTSRQSWVMGELEEQKLCSHTEEAKMPGLINEDLTSRDLKMPAFVQVFSLPENTELVPGIDAAQKGHSRLPLNEVFCSQHTTF